MKYQKWYESDEWLSQHVSELSDELRDLLNQIFVADESQRISIEVSLERLAEITEITNKKLVKQ